MILIKLYEKVKQIILVNYFNMYIYIIKLTSFFSSKDRIRVFVLFKRGPYEHQKIFKTNFIFTIYGIVHF